MLSRAVRSSCSLLPSDDDPSKDPALARLQLSAPVGVSDPSSSNDAEPALPLWKSPKSPKESKELSVIYSSDTVADANVNGSVPFAAAVSENGPNASY